MEKGLVIVNTGNGKGKTTASLGIIIRSLGYGKKTALIQFIKDPKVKSGERNILEAMGCDVKVFGKGFTFQNTTEDNREAFVSGLKYASKAIEDGIYDVIVLDEINCAINEDCFGAAKPCDILRLIEERGATTLVFTGRNAPDWLISISDTATEMREIKHAYNKGVLPKEGIEF